LDTLNLALVFGAGLASVASPCVLPMVPILVTGTAEEHRARPLLLVLGISVSFMAMGVGSSLFGGAVAPFMPTLEKLTGGIVIILGLLMLLDVNLFKHLGLLQRIRPGGRGLGSGLLLGLSLGLIWVPCVGPILSAVLGLVATRGSLPVGILLLSIYSAGFAVPMLAVAYGSQALRHRIRAIQQHAVVIRWVSGLLLVAFGGYILYAGMLGLGAGF
jgi:cytochrome c-type biogenesis protein